MKLSVLLAASSVLGLLAPAALALDAYKTPKSQVVVTGLQPKQKYQFQYKNTQGRRGQRQVKTNACGAAVIAKAANFQTLSINGQELTLSRVPTKTHNRCRPPQQSRNRLVDPAVNPAQRN